LQTATEVLVADPAASLSDVARAAGIGRTTLHKLYPTRHALLVALARDALDLLEHTYREVGLDVDGEQAPAALRRLVTAVVPLGPRTEFLLRERSLDVEPDSSSASRSWTRPSGRSCGAASRPGCSPPTCPNAMRSQVPPARRTRRPSRRPRLNQSMSR
jgi:AcrR family transcriptional regulator